MTPAAISQGATARLRAADGQAAVELMLILPLILTAALAGAAILAYAAAAEHADESAHAGAMALLQDGNASSAARSALPEAERGVADITVRGSRVTVSLPPAAPLRAVLPHLEATATADAGPEAAR